MIIPLPPTPVTDERIVAAAQAGGITLTAAADLPDTPGVSAAPVPQWFATLGEIPVAVTHLSEATLLIRAETTLPETPATTATQYSEQLPTYLAANQVNNALPGVKTVVIIEPGQPHRAGTEIEVYIGEGLTDVQLEHNLQRGFAGVVAAVGRLTQELATELP